MPPRVEKKNAGTTSQRKTADKAPSKSTETPAKPVSSTTPEAEPEEVENAEARPLPTVETPKAEEKAVEPFQDLNEPSIEAEPEKEIPVDDAKVEDIEIKEIKAVMHKAQHNLRKDKEDQDESAENNVVTGERSHGNEAAEEAGRREEGLKGDGGDDQHDMEMPAMVNERRKLKDFEVFVGGLQKYADEEDLKNVFTEVGKVVEIRLPKNRRTRRNKGFGFVRFATVEQAKKAAAELKNPQVRGKQCAVRRSRNNETLFVRNICKSWTKEALKKKLTEYGIENIEEITLREDPQQVGMNKGFAFLEFPTHLEAENACNGLQKPDVFFGIDLCAKVTFAKSSFERDEEDMFQVKSISGFL